MREPGIALRLRGVCKAYELDGRRIEVLDGVDLDVASGEVVALVGQSGSGKSTMLHLLGLLDQPGAGTITYDGRSFTGAPEGVIDRVRNESIGFVFQFHHLLPEFTATENVMMPLLIAGAAMATARERALTLLARVGLEARSGHAPGELSGGEQQRVALARALVLRPRLLLADEPTGNLDPRTGASIHDLLLELNAEEGTTLVVATHNLELAGRMPRRLRLQQRRLHEDG